MPEMASTFFGLADQVGDLLRLSFNGFGGVAVEECGTSLRLDLEQVGGFVENAAMALLSMRA